MNLKSFLKDLAEAKEAASYEEAARLADIAARKAEAALSFKERARLALAAA